MKLSRAFSLSCRILFAHRLRTLLSVTGIVVGVAAVLLMVSAGRGTEERLLSQIRAMGTHLIVVNAGQTPIIAGRQRQLASVTTLTLADARALESCPAVVRTSPAVSRRLPVRCEGVDTSTTVLGLSPAGLEIRQISVAAGRGFDESDNRGSRRVALLGPTVARRLCGDRNPVGQVVRLKRIPFEIIGVTAPKGGDFTGGDQDDLIIVPVQTALRRLFNLSYLHAVYVQAVSEAAMPAAERAIARLLRQRHRLGTKPDDFTLQNQSSLLETSQETSDTMNLLVGGVAGISLLVGGIGILAVMLISVRERTREIGLRRAVGALRRDIRTQFLLESGLLSGAGGLLGVALGLLLVWAASALDLWETVVAWDAAAISLAFSVTVGVGFGLYPAIRASRLEPIQALRAE